MKGLINSIAVLLSISAAFTAAHAGQIAYDQLSSATSFVSFADQPHSYGRPGPVIAGGLTFTSGNGSFRTYPDFFFVPNVGEICDEGCIMTDVELDNISVSLPVPAAQAGGYVGILNTANHAQVGFYSGSLLLGMIDIYTQANERKFAGWDAGDQLITSVRFFDVEDQGFVLTLGGFAYSPISTVPLPPAWFSFAGSIFGLLALRKSKC